MQSIINKENTKPITILNKIINLGERKRLNFNLANLFTTTKIEIPVIIERAINPGPTVLIIAGVHGDELNGIETIRQVISRQINQPTRGTIICMPILNIFGFLNQSRYFPDGKDLNRKFPGTESGSLASRFANQFVEEILPVVDLCLDFHTGGAHRSNAPQIRVERDNIIVSELAEVFNAPFTLYQDKIPNSLRETCSNLGIPLLLNECGKTQTINEEFTAESVNGIIRVLNHLDMLNPNIEVVNRKGTSVLVDDSRWIRTDHSGLLHVKIKNKQWVNEGDVLATVTDPYGSFSNPILSPNNGYIINVNKSPIVYQGDAVFHITTKIA